MNDYSLRLGCCNIKWLVHFIIKVINIFFILFIVLYIRKYKHTSIRRAIFSYNNLISSKDQFELCNAWKEVSHYRKLCDRDNPQTWVQFTSLFNLSSVGRKSMYHGKITPDELKSMLMKVEESKSKFRKYFQETKTSSSTMEILIPLR